MAHQFNSSRRKFITNTGKAGLAAGLAFTSIPSIAGVFDGDDCDKKMVGFTQTNLGYDFKALEPYIDAATMEIHYTKHAAAYAKNLTEACKTENVNMEKDKLYDVLKNISRYSVKMRNNAGGHYNHELFWKMMSPNATKQPEEKLLKSITESFGSVDAMKNQFNDAAKNRFGSGWAWLIINKDKKLQICSTPNQDNPLMDVAEIKGTPVLGIDVWEHAYYLKYQNKRADYINAWWNVVDWNFVSKRFNECR